MAENLKKHCAMFGEGRAPASTALTGEEGRCGKTADAINSLTNNKPRHA